MQIHPQQFSAVSAVLLAVWTIPSSAFTTSLSTRKPQVPLCEGSTRLFIGENGAGTSRSDAVGGDISFAAYQESLKRSNGGANASAGPSEVYQDQYGRTIQRSAVDLAAQESTPMMSMDTPTESQQPSNKESAVLPNASAMMTFTTPPTEHPAGPQQDSPDSSGGLSSLVSNGRQPSSDRRPRRTLVDYSRQFDSFPSQLVGQDRLKPVSRDNGKHELQSQNSTPFSPPQSSSAASVSDASSPRKAIEIMTLTDRMLTFPSQRVGHDRLEPARHGKTTPPTKEDLTGASTSSSSSSGRQKSNDRNDKGYVVAHDPATLCSPFRFLGRPDPNFVIDELMVRGDTVRHNDDTHDSNASKSVAPDSLL
jgi:hypothetical protein